MSKWYVGQEVRVFDINGKRLGWPAGGVPGKVTKVARKFFTVEYHGRDAAFRSDTGRKNDIYGHTYIRTLEEVDRGKRREKAREILKEHHIELRVGHDKTIPLELLEKLADVVREFGEEGK